jgi:hypothetical protein
VIVLALDHDGLERTDEPIAGDIQIDEKPKLEKIVAI